METVPDPASLRTVLHAATYLQELKAKAAEVTAEVIAEDRGYFTPEEEESTLGLLVSYWQTRCALFELLSSLRQSHPSTAPPVPPFLIGFTAAVVLVDAARFLRDVAILRPIVRDKLNEPAPQFGIPPGVFDTIQRSLLSARNGWHLLDAVNYYRHVVANQPAEALAPELRLLRQMVEPLLPRLEVSVVQFARAKLNTRADQVARYFKELMVDRTLFGLQRLAGTLLSERYVRVGHQPGLPGDVARELRCRLQPGDVLMTRKEYALTNYFLPGYWPHAALYLGTAEQFGRLQIGDHPAVQARLARLAALQRERGQEGVVLESMKDGVQLRPLASPFASDSVVILRPKLAAGEIARGLARVLNHESKPYDFDFDFRRSDRLVCTEVVYRAFDGLGGLQIPLVRRAGRPTLAGCDLIAHALRGELFAAVAAFAPRLAAGIREGDEAAGLLRAANADSCESADQAQRVPEF